MTFAVIAWQEVTNGRGRAVLSLARRVLSLIGPGKVDVCSHPEGGSPTIHVMRWSHGQQCHLRKIPRFVLHLYNDVNKGTNPNKIVYVEVHIGTSHRYPSFNQSKTGEVKEKLSNLFHEQAKMHIFHVYPITLLPSQLYYYS